jgi:hypothetical protein
MPFAIPTIPAARELATVRKLLGRPARSFPGKRALGTVRGEPDASISGFKNYQTAAH